MMKLTIVVLCTFACAYAGVISNGWRIIGGEEAADGQFPYQISLRNGGYHSCGGSILDKNTILTAAHCVIGDDPSYLTVVVGTNSIKEGGVSHQVKEIRVNEDYDSRLHQNDIAILKLASDIEFNDNVLMVELEPQVVGGDEALTLSGWGTTSFPGDIPTKLQFVELVSLSVAKCQELQTSFPIVDSEICTLTKAGEGACHGDSGGPLVLSGTGFQVGIVSWGTPCAIGFPDVFTRVSSFTDWIEANRK